VPRAKSTVKQSGEAKPLEEYARKRSFDKTPEPAPGPAKAASGLRYCIQRHDATRLHYDLRLEVDGVLKSWAVPKGPSLDTSRKSLAMHVEDHPIEYGDFEGNIPKGEYGGGSVMLWDRGTYEPVGDMPPSKQIERGDFKFLLHGEKLKGNFVLVHMRGRGKGNEWLVIKKADEYAQPNWDIEEHAVSVKTGRTQEEIAENLPPKKAPRARAKRSPKTKSKTAPETDDHPGDLPGAVERPMPGSITPMQAYLADQPPGGKNWLYEIKWDGVRGICFIDNGRMYIQSRTGNRCERQYPELTVLPNFVHAETAIIDCEIAVLDEQGRPSFSLIQPRIGQSDPNSIAHLSRSTPVTLFAFDLLYWNGFDLRGSPLAERKRALKAILESTDRIRYSEHFVAGGPEMLEAARQAGLEGVMAKRLDSKYESRRSNCWLKIKVHNQQEFVIGGFTHGDREYFSSLVLGVYEGDDLVHVGQVGTGFNDKALRDIYERLKPLITPKSPFRRKAKLNRDVTWVRPELVCEVRFVEWTPENQLRAPAFLGLRFDADPRQVRKEAPGSDAPAEEPAEAPAASNHEPLIPADGKELTVQVGAQSLHFTNLAKVFYPKEGYTKRDILNYYDDVAEYLLPHLEGRPLSLKRYPNGIHGEYFFQKNAEAFPDWIRLEPIPSEDRVISYVVCDNRETLLWLAHLGCIDQNPMMSRVGHLENPDFMLLDLDPVECPYELIVEAAQVTRGVLESIGLEGYPKTTGGDGMHIYVPLQPVYTFEQVRSFAEVLRHVVIDKKPNLFTTPRAVERRKKGRVYFDYLQISSIKTISAPYVLRAHDGAPVATPLRWEEVKPGLLPQQFEIRNAPARFHALGDVFRPVIDRPQRLEPALVKLQGLLGT
jgi:bifunctional non-homologous end joining protein LigD